MNKLGILEGILFVVGDEGINLKNLCDIMNIDSEEAKELLLKLKESYENEERGIRISYLGDAFKLTTKEIHKEYYQRLVENPDTQTLSPSSLEVLAIIAYNQPITRVEIDSMRGLSSAHLIRKLVARGLIKEAGKSQMPGRPNLYRTTSEFLDCFGLASLNELPELEETELNEDEERELFTSIYKEEDHEMGI